MADSDPASKRTPLILPGLVVAQLLATSLWFAANAVLPSLEPLLERQGAVADITTAVQLGFITGTFVFAACALADRFSPSRVFLICALLAALCNASLIALAQHYAGVLGARFLVGFFLAGIYPVGMKIALSWYPEGLGRALGFLVGALVLGTASPHLIRTLGHSLPWEEVILTTSLAAALGGFWLWYGVGDGPHRGPAGELHPRALLAAFRHPPFRASAMGYFGHMWELYAFWAYLPLWLAAHQRWHGEPTFSVSLWSFLVIAAGALGCAGGGLLSRRLGSARVAATQLGISGACCLLSPLVFLLPTGAFLAVMLVWGVTVAGDSPQFSTLNATHAPPQLAGSALTLANCLGFSLSALSLQALDAAAGTLPVGWLYALLIPGPLLGLACMRTLIKNQGTQSHSLA
ncbi:nitrate/nitrite transporter [Motiliproteus sp. SC1-56]|uniref:MFS transporter n=1 Tax=Motiliproteus sp. SC1-56 TaxID=2799565 RepID=UPI001F5D58F0|nr:MFS transporter [Motiliproteus sp. SC1-56]